METIWYHIWGYGLLSWLRWSRIHLQCGRHWVPKSLGGGHRNSLQYSCLEKNPHGQRCLAGYSPWGHKELDMTEWLSTAHLEIYEGWGAWHVLPSHTTQVHCPAPVCILPSPATDVEYCSLSRIIGQSALLCSWWVISHIFPSHCDMSLIPY